MPTVYRSFSRTLSKVDNEGGESHLFDSPNFHFRVYKKGTLHLWFRDLKALEMMNRYAAEREMFVLGSGRQDIKSPDVAPHSGY